MTLANFRTALTESVNEYAVGKLWYWHVPLWLFGLYAFVKLLGFTMLAPLPLVLLVPYSFDFTLHELAHIVTAFLPSVLTASAGSASELLLGSGLVVGAFWFRNYFAAMFCCLWFDLTAQSAGTYMADAIPQQLPLVSLGGALSGQDPVHDWHFVFGQLHMLGMSALIGNTLRVIGHAVGLFGVIFATWILYKMAAAPKQATTAPPTAKPTIKPIQSMPGTGAQPQTQTTSIYPEPSRGPLAPHSKPATTTPEPHSPRSTQV